MRLLCGTVAALAFLTMASHVLAADKKNTKKLQIGVKKRVENCAIRSKSGDTLHMHYTVSENTKWLCFEILLKSYRSSLSLKYKCFIVSISTLRYNVNGA